MHPQLNKAGIHILDYVALSERQKENVDNYFDEIVSKVVTPLAVDPGHPFPHISNLSLNLAVALNDQNGLERFARIKVPINKLPRLVPIKRSSGSIKRDGTPPQNHYFVWLEQVIAANMEKLFPGMEIISAHPFRVTRDADMVIQELEAADLLETMEHSVRQRQFGSVTRLSIDDQMPARLREILIENLEVDPQRHLFPQLANGYYRLDEPLFDRSVRSKRHPMRAAIPAVLRIDQREGNIFAAIRKGDILIHHPYDSFKPVVDFLQQAANDPDVLAIKQTLYRVGRNSPVVQALPRSSSERKRSRRFGRAESPL